MAISIFSKMNAVFICVLALLMATLPSAATQKASAAVPVSAPTITAIDRVAGGLTVSFTAPAGESPAISNYEYSVDGGSSWDSPLIPITESPFTISGLVDCQTYLVSVRAMNSDGAGPAAASWNGVPGDLQYHLNNGFMKFGAAEFYFDWSHFSGDWRDYQRAYDEWQRNPQPVESISSSGNLKQAWYSNNEVWSKLSFASYPLDYGLGVDGDGSAEWNLNGDYGQVLSDLSQMVIDCSQFVETSRIGTLSIGYGTLQVTGQTIIGSKVIEVTRSYSMSATGKYTIFNESIKNISPTILTNARVWVGTRDDWIGQNDSNLKRRGNIVDGAFTEISNSSDQPKVLEVSNGNDTVYFYTTSNLGYVTGLNGYGDFRQQVMNQNPATAPTSRENDGSYGMYLRFQDIAPGASESFTWYYIASNSADAQALLGTVANAALPAAPTIESVTSGNSQASVNFTEGFMGGSAITNYQYSTNGGLTWQTRSPAGSSSPILISGLANGTEYNVRIRAINSEGFGSASSSTPVTPAGPPPAPLITGITQGATSVSIDFEQSDTGGSEILNYEYSSDGGFNWTTLNPTVSTSPLTVSGLSRGTNYAFAIRALNSVGTGVASAIQEARTLNFPETPTMDSVTASNQTLSIPFTLAGNGGTPITNIEYSTDGGRTWVTRSPTSTYSPLLISNLTNGRTYQVVIRAVNLVGNSGATSVVSATPVKIPDAVVLPLNTNVTPSNRSLVVTFTAPNNGGTAITSYEYSTDRGATWRTRTDSGALGTSLQITRLSSDGTTLLTNGTQYCIQLRAVNSVGKGLASNDVCSTPKTVPEAPSLTTISSRDRGLDVGFTLGGNGGSTITDMEYCLSVCGTNSNWVSVGSVSSPLSILGLVNGTAYTVNLRAVNAVGRSTSVIADSSVIPANRPSAPTVTSAITLSGMAMVSFNAPASDGGLAISDYEYSVDGGNTWVTRNDGGGTETTMTISKLSTDGTTPLANGSTYELAIRAITARTVGLSSSSVFVTPSTTPGAPTNAVFTVLNGRIGVNFDAPSDGGSSITNYEYALSENDGVSWGNFVRVNVVTPSFTIQNLFNGTTYRIKIRALNFHGSGEELDSSTTYMPAGVPDSPIISATSNSQLNSNLTDKQIQVNFIEPANNGSPITNYQYSTDDGITWLDRTDITGRFSPLVISKLSSDAATDLSINTPYQIQIRAKNLNGSGDASSPVAARTGGVTDGVPPTVTITSRSGNESASRTLTYDVAFSETIQGISRFDFAQASGSATCSVSAVSANFGSNFAVTVICTTDGTYQLRLTANSVTDGTNLGPVSSQDTSMVTIDTSVPSADITSPSRASASKILTYEVSFPSIVTDVSTADFYQVSGTAECETTSVSAASGLSVTFTVTCTTDGSVTMALRAESVLRNGLVGPATEVSATLVQIDTIIPTATIGLPTINTAQTTLLYVVVYSEVVSDISITDFVESSGNAACQTTGVSADFGAVVTFTVTCTTSGTLQMTLVANSATDGANLGPVAAISTGDLIVLTQVEPSISPTPSAPSPTPSAPSPTPSAPSPTPRLTPAASSTTSPKPSPITTVDPSPKPVLADGNHGGGESSDALRNILMLLVLTLLVISATAATLSKRGKK